MSGLADSNPSNRSDAETIRDTLATASNAEGRTVGWLLRRKEAVEALDRLEADQRTVTPVNGCST
jgi:hypothetical protein